MKKTILLAIFAAVNLVSFGQLDSTQIELSVAESYVYPGETDPHYEVLLMNLDFDDATDLEKIFVVVYQIEGNIVLTEQILESGSLTNQGALQNNQLTWPLTDVYGGISYKVEVNFLNTSGAYTRSCEATLSY